MADGDVVDRIARVVLEALDLHGDLAFVQVAPDVIAAIDAYWGARRGYSSANAYYVRDVPVRMSRRLLPGTIVPILPLR